ncbi:MAG TPA: Fe-S cluster assembly ATPase SufC [Candidatus Binatia bacterium]|nr:Fe-S cluster assembly ATPase SufC [Candidatus Binatia bacterium]
MSEAIALSDPAAGTPADLRVEGLRVSVESKRILDGVDLRIPVGEVHALMGPNGSGKSTLAYTVMGHPKYEVTGGSISFGGEDLLPLTPDKRAQLGLFLSFQAPIAIPGVTTVNFLRAALRSQGRELPARDFIKRLGEEMEALRMDASFRSRYINDGFSGGEKKRAEILQLAMLQPRLAILDEPDSGLDVDALRTVAEGVRRVMDRAEGSMGVLLITHYYRILEHLTPDRVHIMHQGRVVETGGPELAHRVEREGYDPFIAALSGAGREV